LTIVEVIQVDILDKPLWAIKEIRAIQLLLLLLLRVTDVVLGIRLCKITLIDVERGNL